MKKITILAILFFSFCCAQQPGDLVSAEIKLDLSPSGVVTFMADNCGTEFNEDVYNYLNGIPVGLQAYKITYKSLDYNDNLVNATGLVIYPKTNKELSTVLFMAPTTDKRENVPSNLKGTAELGIVLNFLIAVSDYVVVSPDYLGMGDGDGELAYVEDKTAAAAGLDMLKATNTFFEQMGKPRYDEIFVGGYSQGGHAAMAVNKFNQTLDEPFPIKYIAPGAGPYDMSDTMLNDGILAQTEYPNSAFIAYAMQTCHNIGFAQFENDWDEVISDEYYDRFVANALNGGGGLDWGPKVWRKLFQPEFVEALTNDPNHPARECLKSNDVYDFYNKTPTMLFSSWFDKTIVPKNDEVTVNTQRAYYPWWDLGKYNIQKSTLGPWNHFIGSVPYAFAAIYKFNTQRTGGFFNTQAEQTHEYGRLKESLTPMEFVHSSIAPEVIGQKEKLIQKKIQDKVLVQIDDLALLEDKVSLINIQLADGKQRVFPFYKEEAIALDAADVMRTSHTTLTIDMEKWPTAIESLHFIKDNKIISKYANDAHEKTFEFEVATLPAFDLIEIVADAAIFTVKAPKYNTIGNQKLTIAQGDNISQILSHKAIKTVEVYSANGQLIDMVEGNNQKSLPIKLNAGYYIIQVTYADNSQESVKFIQQ